MLYIKRKSKNLLLKTTSFNTKATFFAAKKGGIKFAPYSI